MLHSLFLFLLFRLARPITPDLCLSYLDQPNLSTAQFLADGWSTDPSESGFNAYTYNGIMSFFGPFQQPNYRLFPNYTVTYPVSFTNVTVATFLLTMEGSNKFVYPHMNTNKDTLDNKIKTGFLVSPFDNSFLYASPLFYVSKGFFSYGGSWTMEFMNQKQPGVEKIAFLIGRCEVCFYNCTHTCRSCSNITTTCTSCYPNAVLTTSGTCECLQGFYWNEVFPCPSDDVSTCFKCLTCNPSCKGCWGPLATQCDLCQEPKVLYQGSCLPGCPAGFLTDETDLNNRTCVGACPIGSFLLAQQGVCILDCQNGSFAHMFNDYTNMICGTCSPQCVECSGTSNNCTVCPLGQWLWHGTCYPSCPNHSYPLGDGVSCGDCASSCQMCSISADNCSKCGTGLYLFDYQGKGGCASNCPLQYYADDSTGSCKSCSINCLQCDSLTNCMVCQPGYEISKTGSCLLIKPIVNATILPTNDPLVFSLNFSGPLNLTKGDLLVLWPQGGELPFSLVHNSTDPNSKASIYSLIYSTSNTSNASTLNGTRPFIVYIDDSRTNVSIVPNFISSNITLSIQNGPVSRKPLDFRLFYLNQTYPVLAEFILNGTTFPPSLSPLFFAGVISTSTITISPPLAIASAILPCNFEESCLPYLEISLNFSQSVISAPLLTLSLSPNFVASFPQLDFIRTQASITLLDSVVLSPETESLITGTSATIGSVQAASDSMASTSFLLNVANIASVRFLAMLDLLKFYRYLDVKYPANMLRIFSSEFDFASWTLLDFPTDPRDPQSERKFRYYNISSYFLNNANISLFQLAFCYFLGLLVLGLAKRSRFFRSAVELDWRELRGKLSLGLFLRCCINIASRLIVWNFIISQFLSGFNENMLYVLVTFRWPPLISPMGRANFVIATLFLIIMFCFLSFLGHRTHRIRQILRQNIVLPFSGDSPVQGLQEPPRFEESIDHKPRNIENPLDFSDFFDLSPTIFQRQSVFLHEGHQVVPWEKLKHLIEKDREKINGESPLPQTTSQRKTPLSLKIPPKKPLDISIEESTARTRNPSPVLSKKPTNTETEEMRLRTRYKLLFQQASAKRWLQSYFIFFELGREFMVSVFLISLYDKPVIASILVESLNILMFLVVLFFRPYKEKRDWFLALLGDVGLNIGGLVCVFLALMDQNKDWDYEKRMNLGWIFVVANIIMMVLLLGVFFAQILQFICRFSRILIRFWRNRARRGGVDASNSPQKYHEAESPTKVIANSEKNHNLSSKLDDLLQKIDEAPERTPEIECEPHRSHHELRPFETSPLPMEVIHEASPSLSNAASSPLSKRPPIQSPKLRNMLQAAKTLRSPKTQQSPKGKLQTSPRYNHSLQSQDFIQMSLDLEGFEKKGSNRVLPMKQLMKSCDSPSIFQKKDAQNGSGNHAEEGRKSLKSMDWDVFFKN